MVKWKWVALFFLVAVICLAVALFMAVGWIDSPNGDSWTVGGLLAIAAGLLVQSVP